MAVYRRLCQPLWSWSCKHQRRAFCLKFDSADSGSQEEYAKLYSSRKTVSLKQIIDTHSDLYGKIVRENLSSADWRSIRENILRNPPLTAATVDSTIMDMCLFEYHVDKAKDYFRFLREHDYPLNVAIIGKYLRLFYLKRDQLTDADRRDIVATCDALTDKYPCLDSITAEHCIICLCLTDRWEKSYEILDMLKLTSPPGKSVYSALASAAFEHGKPEIGWDALQKVLLRGLSPHNYMYTSYLRYCEQSGREHFDDRLERMFAFWEDSGLKPHNFVLNAYAEAAAEHDWSAAPTRILKEGQCQSCRNQLSDLKFSREVFQELVDAFMKRVIVGSDIYFKTNPRELQKFTQFISRTKPYDVVIDGLNVTYAAKRNTAIPATIVEVVEHFVKRGQKVLVLTRKHQKRLRVLEYIQRHALVFWTDDLSIDDPYLLYATLASGEKAMFVSSDLMRQHRHHLQDSRLKWAFKKWQCSHQYFVRSRGSRIQIVPPFSFIPHSQKNCDSWHVPYISDASTNPDTYEFPDLWYCFHKKRSK